jgi:hypothetical protein
MIGRRKVKCRKRHKETCSVYLRYKRLCILFWIRIRSDPDKIRTLWTSEPSDKIWQKIGRRTRPYKKGHRSLWPKSQPDYLPTNLFHSVPYLLLIFPPYFLGSASKQIFFVSLPPCRLALWLVVGLSCLDPGRESFSWHRPNLLLKEAETHMKNKQNCTMKWIKIQDIFLV